MIQGIFNAYNMQERNTEMISIDKASDKSLYEQLYEQMKSEILNEHYAAGEKLPATRQLAAEHKLSRNTVVSAYNQLELEGYIRSVTGSGYYVENISAFLRTKSQDKATIYSILPDNQERHLTTRSATAIWTTTAITPGHGANAL